MATCAKCNREVPGKQYLCAKCHTHWSAALRIDEEKDRLMLQPENPQHQELLAFLTYLVANRAGRENGAWPIYVAIRQLIEAGALPNYGTYEEWHAWKRANTVANTRERAAVYNYMCFKGLRPTPWPDLLLAGHMPLAEPLPAPFQAALRDYLAHLRDHKKRTIATLDIQGRTLVAFFSWLVQHLPEPDLACVTTDHVETYLETYLVDGRMQGKQQQSQDHTKTVRTMSSEAGILRAFFTWAQRNRRCRFNPVTDLTIEWGPRQAAPLPETRVEELVRLWTSPEAHPRDAMLGLLCLVYGLFPREIARMRLCDIDLDAGIFRGLAVPAPVPEFLRLVLLRYLDWRSDKVRDTKDDRWLVGEFSFRHGTPVKHGCLFAQTLTARYGVTPRQLRATASCQTIQHGHLKLLTVYGLTSEGMRRYQDLARLVQNTRKVDPKPNLW